jgi:hypothetical protein
MVTIVLVIYYNYYRNGRVKSVFPCSVLIILGPVGLPFKGQLFGMRREALGSLDVLTLAVFVSVRPLSTCIWKYRIWILMVKSYE